MKPICSLRKAARWSSLRFDITVPLIATVPDVGVSRPAQRPRRVVLPLPEGPIIAAVDPFAISKLTDDNTVSSPFPDRYVLVRCSVVKIVHQHL
jgi:hypothetical protein